MVNLFGVTPLSEHLRSKLIRLAHAHPEFQSELLPLLKSADQNAPSNWYGLEPRKPGITEPAIEPKQAAWENLPKGWTQDSVQSMWDTMTGDVKHKITKCMEKMDGKVDDTGAYCGSLAAQVGYKRASGKAGDASLLRKAIIRVAHENPSLRPDLLTLLSKEASSGGAERQAAAAVPAFEVGDIYRERLHRSYPDKHLSGKIIDIKPGLTSSAYQYLIRFKVPPGPAYDGLRAPYEQGVWRQEADMKDASKKA